MCTLLLFLSVVIFAGGSGKKIALVRGNDSFCCDLYLSFQSILAARLVRYILVVTMTWMYDKLSCFGVVRV
jgi:hypothetical protein